MVVAFWRKKAVENSVPETGKLSRRHQQQQQPDRRVNFSPKIRENSQLRHKRQKKAYYNLMTCHHLTVFVVAIPILNTAISMDVHVVATNVWRSIVKNCQILCQKSHFKLNFPPNQMAPKSRSWTLTKKATKMMKQNRNRWGAEAVVLAASAIARTTTGPTGRPSCLRPQGQARGVRPGPRRSLKPMEAARWPQTTRSASFTFRSRITKVDTK